MRAHTAPPPFSIRRGFSVLCTNKLSTAWGALNYGYHCDNMIPILEVGPGGTQHLNTSIAAPENERDGPLQVAEKTHEAVEYFL